MRAKWRCLLALALAVGSARVLGQSFYYVEPGVASCKAAPAPMTGAAKTVPRGVPLSGSISVTCGMGNGSYTVTLNSTDPGATFSSKTFIVNFGRVVGNGAFAVTFATVGVQRLWVTITSNMGSPELRGHFASAVNEFNVVNP